MPVVEPALPARTGARRLVRSAALGGLALALALAAACSQSGGGPASQASPTSAPAPPSSAPADPAPATVVAAGDVASCRSEGDEATAALVASMEGPVIVVGDVVYERGTAAEFRDCYEPSWGRFKDRSRPAVGNHEYGVPGAAGYFDYFGAAAGERGKGWYSWGHGGWHLVALNSNCGVVGCGPGSEQERWLRADLAAARARGATCMLAYWHHPRFSSGLHGSQAQVEPLWRAAAEGGVDVVVAGHDHDYERFTPVDGVRSFVVGTGGRSFYPLRAPLPGSEVRHGSTYGVLVLTLRPRSYDWRFVPAPPGTFTDSGSDRCR